MTGRTLAGARLMLVFTPAACGERDPADALERALPAVDVVQVRVKPAGAGPSPARETLEWTRRALALCECLGRAAPLVIVNDRVDVAEALADEGCAGVHLGQGDTPPTGARELLGANALIGLSTHDARQVVRSQELPVDYLGFGPIHPTRTKGYGRGLGSEAAWIASEACALPLFPIGGIDAQNAGELAPVGRAAVSSAILAAADPERAAEAIRRSLGDGSQGRTSIASP